MTWSHWEQIAGNPAAVFQYSVPRSASSYEVIGYQQPGRGIRKPHRPPRSCRDRTPAEQPLFRYHAHHHQARLSWLALAGPSHRDHPPHHHRSRRERRRPVPAGLHSGGVWAGPDRRYQVHLPGAKRCLLRSNRSRTSQSLRRADRVVEHNSVYRLPSLRLDDKDSDRASRRRSSAGFPQMESETSTSCFSPAWT